MGNQQTQFQPLTQQQDTVVVIGAGPVGLWIAIQLRLRCPQIKVVVLEKRDQYVRQHVLIINRDALQTPKIKIPEFETLKNDISGKCPTNKLEQVFKDKAIKLGIEIKINTPVNSEQDIYNVVPQQKIITVVGADGRNSTIRKTIMDKINHDHENWPYQKLFVPAVYPHQIVDRDWAYKQLSNNNLSKFMISMTIKKNKEDFRVCDSEANTLREHVFLNQVMVKYAVKGKGLFMDKTSYYKTVKLLPFPVTEVVGKQQPGQDITQMTAVFIVPDEVAAKLKHFNPWNPGKFTDLAGIDTKLQESIDVWFNAKANLLQQQVVSDSERINYVPISVYTTTQFVQYKNNTMFALAGDSAFGVPYFRALNNGFECGTELTNQIANLFEKEQNNDNNLFINMKSYTEFMKDRVYEEYTRAHKTTNVHNFKMFSVKVNGAVPWQFIKWYDGDFKRNLYKHFDAREEQELQEITSSSELKPQDYHEELVELDHIEKQNSEKEEIQSLELQKVLSQKYKEAEQQVQEQQQ